jgi:hypothetical protein
LSRLAWCRSTKWEALAAAVGFEASGVNRVDVAIASITTRIAAVGHTGGGETIRGLEVSVHGIDPL